MKRVYSIKNGYIYAFGDTYPIRNRLKAFGASWTVQHKAWLLEHNPQNIEKLSDFGFELHSSEQSDQAPTKPDKDVIPLFDAGIDSEKEAASGPLVHFPELQVSALCMHIKSTLESALPSQFWLIGELTSVRNSRGHTWLEVADSADAEHLQQATSPARRASLTAVLWSGTQKNLSRGSPESFPQLEEGLKVRLLAHVEFRNEGGRIQVVVDDVDFAFTQGQLALTKEKVLKELRQRGLIHLNSRLPLPAFPLRTALLYL